jgi:hypothetical protein
MARIWGRREKERMEEGEDPDPLFAVQKKITLLFVVDKISYYNPNFLL